MIKVTFATDRTVDGKEYKPDQSGEFEPGVAAELLALGYARLADDKKATAKKEEGK